MNQITNKTTSRIFGIDLLRVICAMLIFMRHSITMFNCTWGSSVIDAFILMTTAPVMTCFFMVSGYSMYYTYAHKDLQNISNVKQFYLKRCITIFPTYLLVHFIWIFFMEDSLRKGIILTPVDVLGIQTMYNTLFGILHNGGTWFISCLIFAYFVYPLFQELLKTATLKIKIILGAIVLFILVYSFFLAYEFGLGSNYSNPVYRGFEFLLGVIIASVCESISMKWQPSRGKCVLFLALSSIGVAGLMYSLYTIRTIGMLRYYDVFVAPCLCILLFSVYFIRNEWLEKNRLLQYLSSLSYYFFILQLFLWQITTACMTVFGLEGNTMKIVVSLSICLALSVLMKEVYDRPVKKYLSKKLLS